MTLSFLRSGYNFIGYRTLCGDAHVGRGRPPQHDGEERSARNDEEKISRPPSRDILIKAETTLF